MKEKYSTELFEKAFKFYRYHDAKSMIDHGITIGQSQTMHHLFQKIETLPSSTRSILIQSEIGCGVELIAHRIHDQSHRKELSFIHIKFDDESISESIEEILKSKSKLKQVGTIFIYPLETMDLNSQSILYRFLKSSHSQGPLILAATTKNIGRNYQKYNFLKKLWDLFEENSINIPPLRKRRRDIPNLINAILESEQYQSTQKLNITDVIQKVIQNYAWPQNNKELSFFIKSMLYLSQKKEIHPIDLHEILPKENPFNKEFSSKLSLPEAVQNFEREYIFSVLKNTNGNQIEAAKQLGIHRKTLENKIKKYHLKSSKFSEKIK